ncbi:MAG: twin-arginine translocase TatA/TatE family subunit [Chloroflexi bacterium]|nr:twin-arginine translocase TatA/TatE family subunit [Chloroflexota bacterium]|tara:strand:- start:1378 stop:1551 length:174 start_codon:yes stop_codon:yes gene_type:complete
MGFLRNIGPLEIILILVIILIVFGVGKLPEIGSGVGKAIKEFRNSVGSNKKNDDIKK